MKIDLSQWVSQSPEIMSGEFCFIGTRVPISVLFENLEAGLSVDEILKNWPTIPKEAISEILKSCLFEILATTTPKKLTLANGEWDALIMKNMERMYVDEAYRLEIVRKSLNQAKSRVVSDSGILGGTPVVEGTRVPAETVLAEVDSGSTESEVFKHYPSLPCDGIEACIDWRNAGKPIVTI